MADQAEMNFIKSKSFKNEHYWIGLNDLQDENTFVWTDGTRYDASVFNYWGAGEPNDANSNEDCVKLTNATWNDDICQKNHSYICKRPKGKTPVNDKEAIFPIILLHNINTYPIPSIFAVWWRLNFRG